MDDDLYGYHTTSHDDYADKALMSPEINLMMQAEYNYTTTASFMISDHTTTCRTPMMFGSDDVPAGNAFYCSATATASEAASFNDGSSSSRRRDNNNDDDQDGGSNFIKSKILSHPSYPKLLHAYIDCQKVGAPPEITTLLEEMRLQNDFCKRDGTSMCIGADPELDEFMETYCDILVKFKSDLCRPFDEATTFLNKVELQLTNLCKDDGGVSSDEELSGGEGEGQFDASLKSEDGELKDRLLRKFGSHLSTLKLEFSKKKKKGKLPKEARQMLLAWWNDHHKWPYPTEADKNSLAESTGLDPKQINNWFINQRKRHWKPSEHMQLAVMDNLTGQFYSDDH